jgi:hypothetical protein
MSITYFKIPERYLSLIFNGDVSGYDVEDIKAWEQFQHQMLAAGFTEGMWEYPEDTESYFSWSNDVTNLGDNIIDLQWVSMN